MTELLRGFPALVGLFVVAIVVASIVSLVRRRLHPLQVLSRGLSAGAMLGIVGLAGMLPSWPWWSMWLLAAALIAAITVACRRLLVQVPPEQPTPRQAGQLAAPSRWSLVSEGIVWLAVFLLALSGG